MSTDRSLHDEAVRILTAKGYAEESYPLYLLTRTIESDDKNARRKVFFYKWCGFLLLTSIPLISAALSIGISKDQNGGTPYFPQGFVSALSFCLTLLTVLNAIFRPGERFYQLCRIRINIDTFKSSFLTELTRLTPVDDAALAEFIGKKRKEFESFQEKLIGLFMPMEKQ